MSQPSPDPELWKIVLRPMPVEGDWPPAVRIRLLLKRALRDLKLKCVRLEEPEADDAMQPSTED